MKNHDHVLGVFWYQEGGHLVTFDELCDEVADMHILHKNFTEMGFPIIGKGPRKLSEFFDGRTATCLTRFAYCPECGKKIDWKELKKKAEILQDGNYRYN